MEISMTHDEMVKELSKKLTVTLRTSSTLPKKRNVKPDLAELIKIAEKIRDSVEDYTIETPAQS